MQQPAEAWTFSSGWRPLRCFRTSEPHFGRVQAIVSPTCALSVPFISSTSDEVVRSMRTGISGMPVDTTTTVFVLFHANFDRHIRLGRNVFSIHDERRSHNAPQSNDIRHPA